MLCIINMTGVTKTTLQHTHVLGIKGFKTICFQLPNAKSLLCHPDRQEQCLHFSCRKLSLFSKFHWDDELNYGFKVLNSVTVEQGIGTNYDEDLKTTTFFFL